MGAVRLLAAPDIAGTIRRTLARLRKGRPDFDRQSAPVKGAFFVVERPMRPALRITRHKE
jgi:hypothetical protein